MKALSLWQPWASLWLTDRKPTETRHWYTSHRGWLAVHAAKTFDRDFETGEPMGDILDSEFGHHWGLDLPTGAIIGAVYLTNCMQMKYMKPAHDDDLVCGNWSDERYAWRRAAIVTLNTPIPFRGRQRVFNIPDEIAAVILPSQVAASA